MKNFIFTNEYITNHSYGFKMQYYNKVFRHSDIYGVYVDTNKVLKDNPFIKEIIMNENGSPFGDLVSIEKIDFENSYNVNYTLKIKKKLKQNLYFYLIISIIVILIILINKNYKKTIKLNNNGILYNLYYKYNNFFTEKRFIILIISVGTILFLFHFWLSFPGYFHNPDNIVILKQSVSKNYSNWHPVIIAVTLNFLYKIFGQHTFYLTLINLICLYLGLILITICLYIKTKNKNMIFMLFISCIPNFYFPTVTQLKDITASMYLWLASCIIFFVILIPIQRKKHKILIYIFLSFILILSLLWRHNMIVSIYPIILFLIYLIVNSLNINSKLNKIIIYLSVSLLFAIMSVLIVKVAPYIFIKNQTGYYKNVDTEKLYNQYGYVIDYFTWMDINDNFARNAANNIFFIQIAYCAVENNDGNLIPTNWYEKGKNFEDLKKLYEIYKYDADSYGAKWKIERVFNSVYLEDISKVWLSYIIKYPNSYINFLLSFFKKWISYNVGCMVIPPPSNNIPQILENYGFKNYNIPFNNLRLKLSYFLFGEVDIPIILLFIISIVIFLLSIFILVKFKLNNKILLSLFLSFSSLATFFIVIIFSFIDNRYMYPMFVTTILSTISFIIFIYDSKQLKFISEKNENYCYTHEKLLEIKDKIPQYREYIFFQKKNKYALLMPVINEVERFISQMNKMKGSNIFNICDVYICDGGSKDNSSNPDFIKGYGCKGLIINISDKIGQGVQLKQGFYEAMEEEYDGVVMVDGNDKDNVHESLPLFLEKLCEGYDVVQATRFTLGGKEENTPFLRNIGIRFIASPLISFTSGFHYDDVCNGYKGFSRKYILDKRMDWFREEFNTYEYCYYPLVHVKKLGYKVCQVPTNRFYPKNEVPSKIKGFSSNLKLLKEIFNLAFSKTKNSNMN